jgi:hypothetical protein
MTIGQGAEQNIGRKDANVSIPYAPGTNTVLGHLNTAYYHIHGRPFVYPDHADDVLLTAGTGAWDLSGAITEIIPADTLDVAPFDLHLINISDISGVGTIQIDIYKGGLGSEVLIGATRANRSTNQTRNGPNRIQIPQQLKNDRISCRLSDSTVGALTCLVSFEGHFYSI